jgi:glycosyltransferase involved in cell wall biosynthesis
MRVTIVVGSLRTGGQERVAANMANHWAGAGVDVSIVTIYQRERAIAFDLHPAVSVRDVAWFRWPLDHELDAHTMSAVVRAIDLASETELSDVVLLALLRRCILETEPDAIISLGDTTNIRMLLATDGVAVPRIVSEHCDVRRCGIGEWEAVRGRVYGRANGVVVLTRDAASVFRERYGLVCHVLPNFVAPHPPFGHPLPAGEGFVVGTVARLDRGKRIFMLIDAFGRLAAKHPQWRLEIWGDGPERSRLEAMAGERVSSRGATRDVHSALRRMDLFAMCSATEGFPMGLCEAMAAGVPAVVVDCGPGVRDIVRDGVDGVLVRGQSIREFAAALDRLMSNHEERCAMAQRAPEIVERFSAQRIMRQWEELIGWN